MLKIATKFAPEASAFETAQTAGFRHAEFWLDAALLSRWQEVAEMAQKYPLGYGLHFPNRGDLDDDTLEAATRLYRDLSCTAIVIHTPMFRRYAERLLKHDSTLRLGVENHRLDPQEFERWAVENTWLTLDVEHLWHFTLDDAPLDDLLRSVEGFLKRFGDKLIHVHLPGYVPGYAAHRPMYCSREMVLPVWSLLADCDFDGLIVSEVHAQYQNVQELQMDVLLFERWRELRHNRTRSPTTASQVA